MRGDGTTTRQMQQAPKGALYVWVNRYLDYPKSLARHLARDDLKIVSPDFLDSDRWRGIDWPAVVVDHAARMTLGQHDVLAYIAARRQLAGSSGNS